jgi:DNA gyrase subunit B
MMTELLNLGLEGTKLVLKPRPNLLSARVPNSAERTEVVEKTGEELRKLAELMSTLEEPLETLDRRGVNLRALATNYASVDGLLPRFRVFMGNTQHWFVTKAEMEAFLTEEQQKAGTELRVADSPVAIHAQGPGEETAAAQPAFSVTDLHEIRAINEGVKQLTADFGLALNDLLPATPVNGEPVLPYEIEQDASPRRLASIRQLVSTIRETGAKGMIYTRFKGLGEMNPEELYETAMDPETRILKRINLEDATAAEEIFRVLMGETVEPRREFIEKHALEVRDLDI